LLRNYKNPIFPFNPFILVGYSTVDSQGEQIPNKNMHKSISILIVSLTLLQFSAHGQIILYDILLAGRDVGELKISPAQAGGGSESLRVEGGINTVFYDVVYVGENYFEKGILKTSMSSQEVNGKLKEKTKTIKNQNSYQVIYADARSVPKDNPPLIHPINHTVTSLYYREPLEMTQIYSERFGQMCVVKKVSPGTYEVVMPDGKKTLFSYLNGQCHEVRSEIVGISLVFRIRPDSLR